MGLKANTRWMFWLPPLRAERWRFAVLHRVVYRFKTAQTVASRNRLQLYKTLSRRSLDSNYSYFFVSHQIEESVLWLSRLEPEHSLKEESVFGISSHLRQRLRQSRSGMVLVHSKNIRDMGSAQAPEWCIFIFDRKHTPLNIENNSRHSTISIRSTDFTS